MAPDNLSPGCASGAITDNRAEIESELLKLAERVVGQFEWPVSGPISGQVSAQTGGAGGQFGGFARKEMSNLWFFRLRRAEQQRRRSSGEQSAGSASTANQVEEDGCDELARLARSPSGQPLSSQWICPSANSSAPGPQNGPLQRHQLWAPAEASGSLTLRSSEQQLRLSCGEFEREFELGPEELPDGSSAGVRGWRSARQGRLSAGEQSMEAEQVPQVTITHSDSTSSNLDRLKQAAADGPLQGGASVAGRPLVCELDQLSGSVESKCKVWPPGELEFGAGEQQAGCASIEQRGRVSRSSSELKRGLQDQLVSGKVPPIQQRLLNPSGGGLSLADSMDNLASLIPR